MPRIESFKTVDDDSRYGIFPTNHHSELSNNHLHFIFCSTDGNHLSTTIDLFKCSYLFCPLARLDGTTTCIRHICNRYDIWCHAAGKYVDSLITWRRIDLLVITVDITFLRAHKPIEQPVSISYAQVDIVLLTTSHFLLTMLDMWYNVIIISGYLFRRYDSIVF